MCLSGKESTCQAGDTGLISGSADLLYKEMVTHFCILAWEILTDRGAWQATVHWVARVGHYLASKQQKLSYNE